MNSDSVPPTFKELGIDSTLLDKLLKKGIVNPTPIQRDVFSSIAEGQSLIGFSKTGTGKTLAYLLPLLTKNFQVAAEENHFSPKGLILVPTRELALQVYRDLEYLGPPNHLGVVVVGGESEDDQLRQGRGVFWVIATPGRLLDLVERSLLKLNLVSTVVFDEADRLLDMGFVDDMRKILKFIPKGKAQLLFFSATVNFGIDEMAYEFGIEELKRIGHQTDELTVDGLDHRLAYVGDDEKFHVLAGLLNEYRGKRGIVFSNYKERASQIGSRLRGLGAACEVLTSQVSQAQRSQIMEKFRSGRISVLIASDLAARGLDVSDLDFVINFDLPEDSATYVHRVGRTARAGKKGIAISFVGFEDSFRLERLQKFLGLSIEKIQLDPNIFSGRLPNLGPPQRAPQRNDSRSTEQRTQDSRPAQNRPVRRQESHSHPNRQPPQQHRAPRAEIQKKSFLQKIKGTLLRFLGLAPKENSQRDQGSPENKGDSKDSGIRGRGGVSARHPGGGPRGRYRGGHRGGRRSFRPRGPKT